jgi:hypothetical protein
MTRENTSLRNRQHEDELLSMIREICRLNDWTTGEACNAIGISPKVLYSRAFTHQHYTMDAVRMILKESREREFRRLSELLQSGSNSI